MSRLRVGVAGVHGHGRSHVDAVLALAGETELAATADPRGSGDVPASTRHYDDAAAMIAAGGLDIVVLSTPIPTHVDLTERALAAGAHVLLEKPPVPSVRDHDDLVGATDAAGRAVQVGFQSLGSEGVAATADAAASGVIGEVEHLAAVGLWSRSEEYWRRAPWAGHRVRDGRLVADGAATNPLAHAIATALAIAGAEASDDIVSFDADMRRANDIATDDTSSLVIGLNGGTRLAAGLAVTARHRTEPYVLVRGTRGRLVYHYTLDLLHVVRDDRPLPRTYEFVRHGLLANLAAHVREGAGLLVPLQRTGAFTRVLEAIVSGPEPEVIPAALVDIERRGDETFRIVRGVESAIERVAWEAKTFRELGVLA